MKCSNCGNKIENYRIAGAILAYDGRGDLEREHFMMRLGSLYRTMAMTECNRCGKIEFYRLNAECLKDLEQLPNEPIMEDFEKKYKKQQ